MSQSPTKLSQQQAPTQLYTSTRSHREDEGLSSTKKFCTSWSLQSFIVGILVIWMTILTVETYTAKSSNGDGSFILKLTEKMRTSTTTTTRMRVGGADQMSNAKQQTTINRATVPVDVYTQGKNLTWRFPPDMPFLEALSTCETFKCVRDAHLQPRTHESQRFNFPHFIIAGYSKSASTSLYKYLIHHPEIIVPRVKEASLFTDRCSFEGKRMDCPDERVREYIQDFLRLKGFTHKDQGQRAVFEATPRIMDLGPVFAEPMYQMMPWIKLISSMREPISRSISKHVMLWDKGLENQCISNNSLVYCLKNDETPIMGNPKESYYSHPLKAWVDNFPREQLLLVQYEDLVSMDNNGETQAKELQRIKEFIGVSVDGLPDALNFEDANCRHCRIKPEGWPMKETFYRKLIDKVKPDVMELVRLIDKYNLGNGTRWYENWANVWKANLESCDKSTGMCHIQLS